MKPKRGFLDRTADVIGKTICLLALICLPIVFWMKAQTALSLVDQEYVMQFLSMLNEKGLGTAVSLFIFAYIAIGFVLGICVTFVVRVFIKLIKPVESEDDSYVPESAGYSRGFKSRPVQ